MSPLNTRQVAGMFSHRTARRVGHMPDREIEFTCPQLPQRIERG